jgi:hypothetical protein
VAAVVGKQRRLGLGLQGGWGFKGRRTARIDVPSITGGYVERWMLFRTKKKKATRGGFGDVDGPSGRMEGDGLSVAVLYSSPLLFLKHSFMKKKRGVWEDL